MWLLTVGEQWPLVPIGDQVVQLLHSSAAGTRVPSPPDPVSGTGSLVLGRLSETSVLLPQKTHSSVHPPALTPGMGPGMQHCSLNSCDVTK